MKRWEEPERRSQEVRRAEKRKSEIPSQNVQSTMFGPLLKVERSKKCTPLWREEHFQVKSVKKIEGFGPLFDVETSKKGTPLWREAHLEVKSVKNWVF